MVVFELKYNTAKKMFLNRERVIPAAQVSSVRREESDTEIDPLLFGTVQCRKNSYHLRFWMRPQNLFHNLTRSGEVCLLNLILRAKSKNLLLT